MYVNIELCREIDRSFETRAPRDIDPSSNPTMPSSPLTIKHLTRVNARIQGKLIRRKETAKEEGEAECHESLLKLSKAYMYEETERLRSENRGLHTQL